MYYAPGLGLVINKVITEELEYSKPRIKRFGYPKLLQPVGIPKNWKAPKSKHKVYWFFK